MDQLSCRSAGCKNPVKGRGLYCSTHTPTPLDINRYLQGKEMFSDGSGFRVLIIGGLVLLFVLAGAEPLIKKILALL